MTVHRPAQTHGPLPGRDPLPRRRELAGLRARARGQRLRRAVHPHPEGEPAVGAALRDRRGASPGAPGLQGDLQPGLDHRAARLQDAGPGSCRSARPATYGRVSADRCLTTVDRYTLELDGGPRLPTRSIPAERSDDRLLRYGYRDY